MANFINFLIIEKIIMTTTIKIPTATTVGMPYKKERMFANISSP